MGGFGGAGLAGGASADGEALEVEGDDEGFGFEVVEVEVAGVGDARCSGAVDAGFFDLGEDALFEAVAEGGELGGAFGVEPCRRRVRRLCRGLRCRLRFRFRRGAGARACRRGAWGRGGRSADEEDSDAFGGVDLVAGEGEEVDVLERAFGGEVEGELAGGLDGVGVEESAGCVGDGGEFGDGLDDAGLVVGVHDADEFGVGAEGGFRAAGSMRPCGVQGRKVTSTVVLFARDFGGVEDGVVLDGGGDEVGGFAVAGFGGEDAEEGEVVALGAAGGEDDLGVEAVEEAGDRRRGLVRRLRGRAGRAGGWSWRCRSAPSRGTHGLEDLG